MEYRRVGKSGLRVSSISLGAWLTYGGVVADPDARRIIRTAIRRGVNFIDTADVYSQGKAEKVHDASYYHFYSHGNRLPEMIGVRTERYKLIHYPGMKEPYSWELFDLEKDPDEMENEYSNPEYAAVLERMTGELRALITKLDDPVKAPGLMQSGN